MFRSQKPFASGILIGGIIALTLLAPAARAQTSPAGKPLTVETIFGRPGLNGRPTPGMAWAPDGKTVTYFHVDFDGGKPRRELWSMDAATGTTHVLVSADKLENLLEPPKDSHPRRPALDAMRPRRISGRLIPRQCSSRAKTSWCGLT